MKNPLRLLCWLFGHRAFELTPHYQQLSGVRVIACSRCGLSKKVDYPPFR